MALNNRELEQIEDRLYVLDNMRTSLQRAKNEAPTGKYEDNYFNRVVDYIDMALSRIDCDMEELEAERYERAM